MPCRIYINSQSTYCCCYCYLTSSMQTLLSISTALSIYSFPVTDQLPPASLFTFTTRRDGFCLPGNKLVICYWLDIYGITWLYACRIDFLGVLRTFLKTIGIRTGLRLKPMSLSECSEPYGTASASEDVLFSSFQRKNND